MAFDNSSLPGQQMKPFICSTDDFVEERQLLSTRIFPQLQSLCRERAASFVPCDWDHNIGLDRLSRGLALHLALKCIGSSSPYFIGLLGNQYGDHRPDGSGPLPDSTAELPSSAHWVDKNVHMAAKHGYRWLLDESYASSSLFELKITQAAFLGEETKFCRLYIRDQAAGSSPQNDLERYDKFKMQQLKANIAKRGLYASYYTSLEELGELVLSDWKVIIDQVYPPLRRCRVGQ